MNKIIHLEAEEYPNISVIIGMFDALLKEEVISNLEISRKDIKILPLFSKTSSNNNKDKFENAYIIQGITISEYSYIVLTIVSGTGSFVDYIVSEKTFSEKVDYNNLLHRLHDFKISSTEEVMALIEVTKTSDKESRNSASGQRLSKFVSALAHYPNAKMIMYYDHQHVNPRKKVSSSWLLMQKVLGTMGVAAHGANGMQVGSFNTMGEFIEAKKKINPPPSGQPVKIYIEDDIFYMSIKLDKGSPGNPSYNKITHDPNIGIASAFGLVARKLGWKGRIIITNHNVKIRPASTAKFVRICNFLAMELDNQIIPKTQANVYYKKNTHTEKIATILLAILFNNSENFLSIFENHAGSERGYFKTKTGVIPLAKELKVPDLVVVNSELKVIYLCEGEMGIKKNIKNGDEQLRNFDKFIELLKIHYPDFKIKKYLIINGGTKENISLWAEENVLFHIDDEFIMHFGLDFPKEIRP